MSLMRTLGYLGAKPTAQEKAADDMAHRISNMLGAAEMLSGPGVDCIPLITKVLLGDNKDGQLSGADYKGRYRLVKLDAPTVETTATPAQTKRRPNCF